MRVVVRLFTAIALCVFISRPATATPISVTYADSVTGWEWAEVAETTGLTWNQVAAVCAQDGVTACTGNIDIKEFLGWIWATSTQVRDLFVNATDLTSAQMLDGVENGTNTTFAPQFLALFAPTFTDQFASAVSGWSSSSPPGFPTDAITPFVNDAVAGQNDTATVIALIDKERVNVARGVWLHRAAQDIAPVPEPASLVLLGTGLAAAAMRSYRHRPSR